MRINSILTYVDLEYIIETHNFVCIYFKSSSSILVYQENDDI